MLNLGWVIQTDKLPELYRILQYAEVYCKSEILACWTSGKNADSWKEELSTAQKWVAYLEAKVSK